MRLRLLIWFCFSFLYVQAQKLNKAEYFIDYDLGAGLGNPISISKGDSIAAKDILISVVGLKTGPHILGIRVRDSLDHWSPTFYHPFHVLPSGDAALKYVKNKLRKAEYYIDIDPGAGAGIPIAITSSDSLSMQDISVPTTGLALGYHVIGLRVKDSLGRWSPTLYRPFHILLGGETTLKHTKSRLKKAEYYIDIDPGAGMGIPVAIPSADSVSINDVSVPLTGLANGQHILGFRVRDSLGRWSPTTNYPFTVHPAGGAALKYRKARLNKAEYYVDKDPGPGFGIDVPVSVSDSLDIKDIEVSLEGITPGSHYVAFRVRDSLGLWSPIASYPFKILESGTVDTITKTKIVYAEYFFGSKDPGYGKGIKIINVPADSSEWDVSVSIDNVDLPLGIDTLTFRCKQNNGLWTRNETFTFSICLSNPTAPIASGATICEGSGTAKLKASKSPTKKYLWYDKSWGNDPASGNYTDSSYTTPLLTASRSYWVATSDVNNPVCNSLRTKVDVEVIDVIPLPTATQNNYTRCGAGHFTLTAATGAPLGGTYRWYDKDTTTLLHQGAIYITDSLIQGQQFFLEAITSDTACKSQGKKPVGVTIVSCNPQTITFDPIPNLVFLFDVSYKMTAVASPSNLPVTFVIVEGGEFAEIRNDTIIPKSVGRVVIRAEQDGSANYNAAPYVYRTFNIKNSFENLDIKANTPVCGGQALYLTSSTYDGAKYEWEGPNGFKSNISDPVIYNVDSKDAGNYFIKITLPSKDILAGNVKVRVKKSPVNVSIYNMLDDQCAKDYTFFTKGDSDLVSYQWYYNAKVLIGEKDSTLKPLNTGVYSVVAFNKDTCSVSAQPIYVDVDPDSIPEISRLREPARLGTTIAYEKYQWYVDNYYIAGSNLKEIPLVFNGSYKVKIVDDKGCERFSFPYYINDDQLINLKTGMLDPNGQVSLNALAGIQMYPSPVKDLAKLEWISNFRGDFEIRLVNMRGELLYKEITNKDVDYFSKDLNTSSLSPGLYIVYVQRGNQVKTVKFVVER